MGERSGEKKRPPVADCMWAEVRLVGKKGLGTNVCNTPRPERGGGRNRCSPKEFGELGVSVKPRAGGMAHELFS